MSFQLEWAEDAEQELTLIWLRTRFRSQITETVSLIEQELRRDPNSMGESREQ